MSKNKILQPKIRFKEFSGENAEAWEQRKLGELGDIVTGNTPSTKDKNNYSKDGIIWVTPTDIVDNITFNSAKRLSEYGITKAKIVPKNSVLITSIASIGKNTLLGVEGSFNQQINALVPNEYNSPYFLYTLSSKWSKSMLNIAGKGTMQIVNKNQFSKIKTTVPLLPEQKSIENLFILLDSTITLHQRKLETLESLKKTLLSKMFPKNGKAVPELRFAGFTDNWEQRKLGEITSITMGQSPNSVNYTNNPNDHILVQGNADILNGKVNPRVWTKEVTKTAEPGDIILTVRAPVGDVAVTEYNVVLGRGVASIKGNGFIFQLLKTFKLNGYWLKLSTGSTFDSINSLDLKNTTAYIPNKTEQDAISFLLSIVDTTITLHQRKIEQYQELKKTLLSKMFI
ncbi:restriction endonuclease subunit S [Globicatella sp. PHS-GS-PNBC-21-1553]|uniref:restriction endonuclease subunit S n=1 Tax=Globicatella sp. PHS-GS-PNBC-21-1553 TaxID=2885764 RepID=UPI00298F389F|nr:restriction endonuclease subunit S [Globicatella sp. PHS-GS-PNBC-21-1553]WPC08523.1 restriction endonuclease subunit S [Globicatella sp. PHS-GS-PNBC-21-1553]